MLRSASLRLSKVEPNDWAVVASTTNFAFHQSCVIAMHKIINPHLAQTLYSRQVIAAFIAVDSSIKTSAYAKRQLAPAVQQARLVSHFSFPFPITA